MDGMTLFTGFDGAGLGMKAAGVRMVAGIEYDAEIAEVARMNGIPVTVGDVCKANPADFLGIQALHASPPCPNFSVAKASRGETAHDIELARAVCRFIEALRPLIFTLENVYAYRNSKSWRMIENTLYGAGYWLDIDHVNAADYGVPQTRQRMIVRAIRGAMVPHLPEPEPWIGWYAAIEDLIPALPESRFADWQLDRLPAELRIMADAFLVHPTEQRSMSVIAQDDPAFTITGTHGIGGSTRAFLVNTNQSGDDGAGIVYAAGSEPAFTTKPADDGRLRAWLSQGRVVKMTPRALARFQSFPDWYQLPDKSALACRGIGNACPPLLMEKIYRPLLETTGGDL